MSSFEKSMLNIYSAFTLEYSRATTQLSEFFEVVNSFFSHILSGNCDNEEYQQNTISKIQDVCFFLKTFCSETELHMQLLKLPTTDDVINPDIIEEEVKIKYQPPENLNEIYPFELYPEIFTYDSFDLSTLMVGLETECYVSFIKDLDNLLFFLMNSSCTNIVIKPPEFLYDSIPNKGIIFGLMLDGAIVRAVRENTLKKRPISFKAFLIDFGEILEITKEHKMYQLPEQSQKVPGQAIYCKLIMNDDENSDGQKYLEEALHNKKKIRVERLYKNMLGVTFLPSVPSLPSVSLNTTSSSKTQTQSVSNSENSTHEIMPENQHQTISPKGCNGELAGASGMSPNPIVKVNNSEKFVKAKDANMSIASLSASSDTRNENATVTEKQMDELNEETFNTQNALVAVMGYAPQDDKRICKFFDPKTNACFKGANCKLEHTTILKDGWTKDKTESKLKIHSQIPMPRVGKKFNILVTYVVDVEKFYGQLIPLNCKESKNMIAQQLIDKMNSAALVSKFKKFIQPPDVLELVFAMFRDGFWYRARILEKYSDIHYKVNYVDYGNCSDITIDEMRMWDDAFDCYPFQALTCKLDNVTKIKELHKEAIAYLETLILQKALKATVTCNIDFLYVTLEDQDKFDIGEQLCAAEYATYKPITKIANGKFPG